MRGGDIMKREPVVTVMSISALVSALLYLLVTFGVPITNDQIEAILGFVAVSAPIGLGIWYTRSQVTPVNKDRR
jgi:hypothetical protein